MLQKQLYILTILIIGLSITACTTTTHQLQKTSKIKVYPTQQVLNEYQIKKTNPYLLSEVYNSKYLLGFSFSEQKKSKKTKLMFPLQQMNTL